MARKKKKAQDGDDDDEEAFDPRTREIFERKGYEVEVLLGCGSFGEVYRGLRLATDEHCAVKVMHMDKMTDKYRTHFLPRELASLMELRHEHIIHTYDIFRANNCVYVFMEFAPNGDLARYLKAFGAQNETRSRIWFQQLGSALYYLHDEMCSAHRDLKIDNVLINQFWMVKLTDFGFVTDACVDDKGREVLSKTYCGTKPYYSPQIASKVPYNAFKSDVWAFGVVLYAICHNKFPFHFKDLKSMVKEQKDEEYKMSRLNKTHSQLLQRLLLTMWEYDEDSRPPIRLIMSHPWVKQYSGPLGY